ncbi:MerR family transcriptional regulator [Deinococcus cellulosilyticus]|uniref:HTH merR-type domain-containing protein n=1 Tax=Deinococcus cellulosilyticus (strain DSM 18568 / NBRC 106333 / KACC 11606 / 5516J-15) TaxID=1223518 RepID=A0A511MYR3_DEIC1|nr:MerR family transcriptional regulator [Deinococcus cellulosilyticus]GEM45491.1 hypothetical protein DC3_11260 [Deinococcus cellulosilyticus NBRC 106333 = KACC 11606]
MSFTIGQLSRSTGESIKTLRFWSNQGLLTHTVSESQYRQYTMQALEEVQFIRQAQKLGWSLHDIKTILQQGCSGEGECSTVISELERHILEAERQIQQIQKLKGDLQKRLDWAREQESLNCSSPCCVILLTEA